MLRISADKCGCFNRAGFCICSFNLLTPLLNGCQCLSLELKAVLLFCFLMGQFKNFGINSFASAKGLSAFVNFSVGTQLSSPSTTHNRYLHSRINGLFKLVDLGALSYI